MLLQHGWSDSQADLLPSLADFVTADSSVTVNLPCCKMKLGKPLVRSSFLCHFASGVRIKTAHIWQSKDTSLRGGLLCGADGTMWHCAEGYNLECADSAAGQLRGAPHRHGQPAGGQSGCGGTAPVPRQLEAAQRVEQEEAGVHQQPAPAFRSQVNGLREDVAC